MTSDFVDYSTPLSLAKLPPIEPSSPAVFNQLCQSTECTAIVEIYKYRHLLCKDFTLQQYILMKQTAQLNIANLASI